MKPATGAVLPFADPARDHGVAMEGTFWRFTDATRRRVAIVLLGACRDRTGERWSLVAVATHPGGEVRWAIGDELIDHGPGRLRVRLDDATVEASWSADHPWPRRAFGALGPAQMIPWLGQYWHPHLLSGTAAGTLTLGGETWKLDGATVYSERNWGSRFAPHWWWGQAHDLGDGGVCAAFAGGRMLGGAPTALVVALEDRPLIRLSPPLHAISTASVPGRWRVRAGGVELEAEADPATAHVLPVPVPAERRADLRSHQHLAGRLALTVRRRGGVVFRGETELAGLERGLVASG